jgi:D-sedoheptulose 7-phosphate isomerase
MNLNCLGWLTDLTAALSAVACRSFSQPVSLEAATVMIAQLLQSIRSEGNAVWWVGNGGSAAICSHLSQDLVNKLGIRSSAINDAALITTMANDYGYSEVYLRPLQVLARKGDLVIAISSSGCSQNILAVTDFARDEGMRLVTLSGFASDNPLWQCPANVSLHFPSSMYGQVEIGHAALLHAVIESLWVKEQAKRTMQLVA